MPTHYTFILDASIVGELPPYPGRALHGLCYDWIARGDADLAEQLHTMTGPAPFTVALLPARRASPPRLSLALLDDTLCPAVEAGIAQTPEITVLDQTFALPAAGPDMQRVSYTSLAASVRGERRMRLRFVTPTSFHIRNMHQPLPIPVSSYQSWLRHWNVFAPEELHINVAVLDLVVEHVAVARYRLHTKLAELGNNRKMVGFIGTVDYLILQPGKLGDDWIGAINLLANYAPYCGTGHKTTQGMGKTERLR